MKPTISVLHTLYGKNLKICMSGAVGSQGFRNQVYLQSRRRQQHVRRLHDVCSVDVVVVGHVGVVVVFQGHQVCN